MISGRVTGNVVPGRHVHTDPLAEDLVGHGDGGDQVHVGVLGDLRLQAGH
jgi:hypothetical protein